MHKTLLVKTALVAALFLILLVPLQMIGGLVAERQGRQQEVAREIAESSFGRQAFAGPFVNFPYVEEYEQEVTEEKKDKTVTRIEQRRIRRTVDGRRVHLTPTESRILGLLARNPGKLLTHRTILREVWGAAYGDESNYLHVYVSQLRRKLEPDPARPRHLITEAGAGYRLVDPS